MAQIAAVQIKLSLQTTGEAAVKRFMQSIQKLTVAPPKIDFSNSIGVSTGSLQRAIQKQMPLIANTIADGIEIAFVRIWHRFSDFLGLLETEAQKKKGMISKILLGDNIQTTLARQMTGVVTQFQSLALIKRSLEEGVGLGVATYRTLKDAGVTMANHYTNKVAPMLLDATQKSYKLTTVVAEADGMIRRGNGLLRVLGSSLLTVSQGISGLLTTGGYFFFSGVFFQEASQFVARFLGLQKGTTLLERINRIVITIDRSLHHAHLTIGALLKSTSIGIAAFVPTIFGIINPFTTIITKLAFVNSLVTLLGSYFERKRLSFSAFLGSGSAQIRLAFLNVRDFLIALTTDAGFLGTRATKIFAFFGSHSAKLKLGLANFREFFMSLTGMMPKITESLKNIIGYLPTVTKEWGKMQASKDNRPQVFWGDSFWGNKANIKSLKTIFGIESNFKSIMSIVSLVRGSFDLLTKTSFVLSDALLLPFTATKRVGLAMISLLAKMQHRVTDFLVKAAASAKDYGKTFCNGLTAGAEWSVSVFSKTFNTLKTGISSAVDFSKRSGHALWSGVLKVPSGIMSAFKGILGWIGGAFKSVGSVLSSAFTKIFKPKTPEQQVARPPVQDKFNPLVTNARTSAEDSEKIMRAKFQQISNKLKSVGNKLKSFLLENVIATPQDFVDFYKIIRSKLRSVSSKSVSKKPVKKISTSQPEQSSVWDRVAEMQMRSAQRAQAVFQSQQKIRTAIKTSQLALPNLSTQVTSRATPVKQERPSLNVLPSGQKAIPLPAPIKLPALPDLRPEAEKMRQEILLSIQKLRNMGYTFQAIERKIGKLETIATSDPRGAVTTRTTHAATNFAMRKTVPARYLTQSNVDKARLATLLEGNFKYVTLRAQKIPDEIAKGIQQNPEKLKKAMEIMTQILLQYLPSSPAKVGPLRSLRARGIAILSELAIGMNSNSSKLKQSVFKVAQSIARFFPHSPAEEGPLRNLREWGQKILGTISLGLSDKLQSFLGFFWNLGQQIRNTIKPILELEMQGKRSGVDAKTMSLLQYAFVGFEVSASDVQMSLLGINRTLSEIVTPEKQMALARVGINISKIRTAANPSYEALLQLADATQKFPLASQEMIKAFDAIGISNQTNLINGLSQGRAKIEEAMQEGVKMGAAYNETFVKASHDFAEMLNKIDNIASYLEREFVDVILPIVDDLVRKLFDFYKDNAESVRAFVRTIAEVFKILISTVSQAITMAIANPGQAKEAVFGFFIWLYQSAASLFNTFLEDSFDGLTNRVWLFLKHTVGGALNAALNMIVQMGEAAFRKLGLLLLDLITRAVEATNVLGFFDSIAGTAVETAMEDFRSLLVNADKAGGSFEDIINKTARESEVIMAAAAAAVEKDILDMSDPAVIKKTMDRFGKTGKEIFANIGTTIQGTGFDKLFTESMAEINNAVSAGNFEKVRTEIQKINQEFTKLPSILDQTGVKGQKINQEFTKLPSILDQTGVKGQEISNTTKNEITEILRDIKEIEGILADPQSFINIGISIDEITESLVNAKKKLLDLTNIAMREAQQVKDKILSMQLDLGLRVAKDESERAKIQAQKDALELKGKHSTELAEYEQLLHAQYIKDNMYAQMSSDEQKKYIQDLSEYKEFVANQEREREVKKPKFKILDDKQTETINAWQSSFNNLGTAFGNMYELMGKKATAFFYLQKGVAVADATISGTMATLNAYEKGMEIGGPTVAAIFAAMAAAMSATQIATIVAQAIQGPTAMATGGTVPGQGNKDTVPAMLTPGEFVMPRGVVEHYGLNAMEAMRQRLISKEVFGNLAAAIPKPEFSQSLNFNNGGIIPPLATPAQSQQPINIVNIQDSTQIDRYMASHHGQQVVMNIVSNNFSQLQRRMR